MSTTIQVANETKEQLDRMKLSGRDTYNDVLERVLEDIEQIDEETRKEIHAAREQIKKGKFRKHEDVKKEFGVR